MLDAAAYGVPSELGEEDVKLDVVLREPVSLVDLHGWLVENLPRFMVPRYLEIRDTFPKTPSERIEKYKLQADSLSRPEVFDTERGPAGASSAEGCTLTSARLTLVPPVRTKEPGRAGQTARQAPAAPPVTLTAPFRAGETTVTTEARAHD